MAYYFLEQNPVRLIVTLSKIKMTEKNKMSRREAVAGIGLTLATAALAPMQAIASQHESPLPGAPKLEDPTKKYPKPPFKYQPQEWPGLQSKMDPVPDCGETSYKGSGRLMGRKALITGGDSGMGRAAAIAYAREGADVAINYYPTEEPDAKQVIALLRRKEEKQLQFPGICGMNHSANNSYKGRCLS